MSKPFVDSKARHDLAAWLGHGEGRTQTALARALGITPSNVSRWIAGLSRPDSGLREAVRLATGIAPADWLTDSERAEETERLRRAATSAAAEPAAPAEAS